MIALPKIKQYFLNSKKQLLRFFIIGVSSTFLDLELLILFKEKIGFTPILAVAINQIIVITYNFLLNKYWSFVSKKKSLIQLSRYLTIVAFNYSASIFLMYLFYNLMGANYKIVRVCSIALLFVFNFIFYKHWVYSEK